MTEKTPSRLEALTHVRREEAKVVFLMMLYGFLAMTSYYVVKPVRNAVFVERLGADNLPYVYILTAVIVSLVMVVYSRYVHKVGHVALIVGTLAFLASNLLLFRWFLMEETFIVSGIFYIWGKLFPLLVVSQYWLVGNLLFTTRQAKRLFGPIGVGLIVGGIAGSSLAAVAAHVLGSENLLLAAAIILGVCILLVFALRPYMQDKEGRRSTGRLVGKLSGDAVKLMFESPHLRWIAAILFITILVSTLGDWQLNRAVELFVPGEDAKTQFFGRFFLVLNVVSVAIQVLLTSLVLRKFGVGVALLALPAGLLLSQVGVLLLPVLLTATMVKGSEQAIRYSLDQSTRELLFLPLPTDVKYKVKPLIDLAVYRGGTGVGGILLLVLTNWLGLEMRGVAVVALGLVALWVVATFRMKVEFKNSVKRLIGVRDVALNDLIVQRIRDEDLGDVREALTTGDEDEVIYALGLLAHHDPRTFSHEIRELLQHESPQLRARAMKLLTMMRYEGAVAEARALLVDLDLDVRIAAMEYVSRFGTDDPAQELRDALADEAYGVRAAAIAVILMHSGPIQEGDTRALQVQDVLDPASEALEVLSSEEALEARLFAARLLVNVDLDSERGRRMMRLLLDDPDPSVRHAAMHAASTIKSDVFLGLLVERLGRPEDRGAAVAALSKRAPETADLLFEVLRDSRAAPSQRLSIPRILRSTANEETVDRLIGVLRAEETPPQLRFEILKTLGKLRRDKPQLNLQNEDFARHDLDAMLMREVREAYLWARRLDVLREDGGEDDFLSSVVRQRMHEAAERAFRVLGLQYELEDLEAAFVALRSSDDLMQQRGFELVDNALPLRKRVLFDPLLNPEKSSRERAAAAEARFQVHPETRREILEALCGEDGVFVRALARSELGRTVEGTLSAEALREEMASRLSLVLDQPHTDEGIDIMDIVQRADMLRRNKVFGELRGEELAGIAALLDEQRFKKGHRLTGEEEAYLYIVVEGEMGMVRDDEVIARAKDGEVFFDPGLLDGEEAESEMVALDDTRALRLSRLAFTRIMEERFTVVRGLLNHLGGVVRGSSNGAAKSKEAPTQPKATVPVPGSPGWGRRRRSERDKRVPAGKNGKEATE
jgi:AAA family ATP:ADP antiporter